MTAEPSFEGVCVHAASVLAGFEGYFIERISHDTESDSLLIQLQGGPSRPDAILLLGGLRYLSLGDTHDLKGSFVDEAQLTFVPRGRSHWPEGLTGLGPRHSGLPDLAWLRIFGPTDVDAVAARVQVYLGLVPPG